jgi:RNA polymerase sigma-70 factor (ECF subfamily)
MRPVPPDLPEILAGCRRQDARQQRRLYDCFHPYALNICLHYAGNRAEAEEMVHDGFLKVFRYIDRFRGEGTFAAWFRRTIVNAAIDYYHRHRRLRSEQAWADPLATTSNRAPGRLDLEDAYRLLQYLSPGYRLAINLHVLEGYSHTEIAKKLGISRGASKSNLARAKQQLRQLVAAIENTPQRKTGN